MAGRRDKKYLISTSCPKVSLNTSCCYRRVPSTLFFNNHIKTVLDLLKPNYERQVFGKQSLQKQPYDGHSHKRNFTIGNGVVVKIHWHNCVTWQPGTIVEKLGPVSYIVNLHSGLSEGATLIRFIDRKS